MRGGELKKRLVTRWSEARDGFWLLPATLAVLAVLLAAWTLWLDTHIERDLGHAITWLFGGTAEGAWTLLQVIAGSLITVISVAFSVTLIAIQQASAQYSPRLLRNFTSDRANQLVLGTYVATFVYALLVLRQVREGTEETSAFVPAISLFVAFVLAVVSLGMLIFYIHHITESLQLPFLLSQIREELDQQIERQFPETFGANGADSPNARELLDQASQREGRSIQVVRCEEEGYLSRIDEAALQRVLERLSRDLGLGLAAVPVPIGAYLRRGVVLLRVWTELTLPEDAPRQVRAAFQLGGRRSVAQDPMFGFEQMTDVAVKALSPSVNDPTTASQALDQIGAALSLILAREIPSPARRFSPEGQCVFRVPDFADFVEAAFGRIRRASGSHVGIHLHLLELLAHLAEACPSAQRAEVLRHHVHELRSLVEDSSASQHDKATVLRRADEVLAELRARPAERR
jgi:uncharacterized membrane protein